VHGKQTPGGEMKKGLRIRLNAFRSAATLPESILFLITHPFQTANLRDGLLEIEFCCRMENPKISAFEIQRPGD